MAYKVFTNGSPLPASDLNTYLMNQSVMVFANSTARSAALTAPTEGMVTYLEDTNKLEARIGSNWVAVNSPITTQGDLIVGDGSGLPSRLAIGTNGQFLTSNGTTATWATIDTPDSVITSQGDLIIGDASGDAARLGIGSTGQVLTVSGGTASWASPGGGDKVWTSVFNSSVSLGSSSFTISSLPSYDNYIVRWTGISTSSSSPDIYLYPNSSTSGNFISYAAGSVDGSGRYYPYFDYDTGKPWLGNYKSSAGNEIRGMAIFSGCKGTAPASIQWFSGSNTTDAFTIFIQNGGGLISKTSSISSFTFDTNSGTFDAAAIRIWGA